MNTELMPTDLQVSNMRQAIVTALPQRQRQRQRRRTQIAIAVVGALVLGGATTAGSIIYNMSIQQINSSFDCYTTTSVGDAHGTSQYPSNLVNTKTVDPLADRVSFALQTCEAGYSAVPTVPSPGAGPFDVPNPTACMLEDGRIAVFPNEARADNRSFCGGLGLRTVSN